jgi:tetratricopeptide (TPR) repeat protein
VSDRFKWLEYDGEAQPERGATPTRKVRPGSEAAAAAAMLRARQALTRGEYEPALRAYSAALQDDPDEAEAWAGQVRCLVSLGQPADALQWAQRGLERHPSDASVQTAHALALARASMMDEAVAALEPFDLATLSTEARLDAACTLLMAERPAAAVVATLPADDPSVQRRLAEILLAKGDGATADRFLSALLQMMPEDGPAWLLAARAARLMGRKGEWEKRLKQAQELKVPFAEIDREKRSPHPSALKSALKGLFGK